jgi:hypothetical protein
VGTSSRQGSWAHTRGYAPLRDRRCGRQRVVRVTARASRKNAAVDQGDDTVEQKRRRRGYGLLLTYAKMGWCPVR